MGNVEIEYDHENDDLIEVDYSVCQCPEWDRDRYCGIACWRDLCVACGKPIKEESCD